MQATFRSRSPLTALVFVALAVGLSACSASTRVTVNASASPSPARSGGETSGSLVFVAIVDIDDQGVTCDESGTTLEMATCFVDRYRATDALIDNVQRARFDAETTDAGKLAILNDDAAWLKLRVTTCKAKANSGGTLDQITFPSCLADEAVKRLAAVKALSGGDAPTMLRRQIDTYTAADGSKISMGFSGPVPPNAVSQEITVVAGPNGFVVHPFEFTIGTATQTSFGTLDVKDGTQIGAGQTLHITATFGDGSTAAPLLGFSPDGTTIVAEWK